MSLALRERLREALSLPEGIDDDAIVARVQSRETLRRALVDAMADAQDSDEFLIVLVRDLIEQAGSARRAERARLAKEILIAAVPFIWPCEGTAEDAVGLADALLAALDKPVQL